MVEEESDGMDGEMEAAILKLLGARGPGKTICPSEAARAVDPEGWPKRMEAARRAAWRLVAAGRIVVTQGGRVVDGSTAKRAHSFTAWLKRVALTRWLGAGKRF